MFAGPTKLDGLHCKKLQKEDFMRIFLAIAAVVLSERFTEDTPLSWEIELNPQLLAEVVGKRVSWKRCIQSVNPKHLD